MHLGNATCKNIGINYEAALALDARSQKAECFRLIRLSVSASGRRFLPSADTHTHTLIHLKLAPPPLDYPSSDFPTLYASQAVLWPSLWSPPFICSIVKLVVSARQLIMITMVAAAAAASPLSPYPATKLLTLQCIHPLTMAQTPADPSTSPPHRQPSIQWIDGNFFQSACKWLWILIKKQVACAVHLMSLMLGEDDDDGFPAGCPVSLFSRYLCL